MKKFHVYGIVTISVGIELEAEDKEAAIEAAYEKFGGIGSYVGNGGCDKLIGVTAANESIDADGEIEWSDADEI